jgi:thiosulfate/3-mercaptopyruvate sulfurtransferase
MSLPTVLTTEWLAAHLGEPDLRIIDATWYLPTLHRDAGAEYVTAHVPGAAYFDIDAIKDTTNALPHMLPDADSFAAAVGALGVAEGDRVVVYGQKYLIASARVWWTFRVFGHDRVAVLDGGFPKWKAEGRPVESGAVTSPRRRFTARLRPELVRDLGRMRANVDTRREQVVDARSHGRFVGTEPEPRAGVRSGHIPGSVCLPYDHLFRREDGTLLSEAALREAFDKAGVDGGRPIVTTCGSGVSAAVLALGLHVVGRPQVAVYDGSWTEWGGRSDTPVEI